MRDSQTTIAQLRELVREFVAERDWRQFHTPKNLSMSLAIEAGELMEHFQWLTPKESRSLADDAVRLEAVADELANELDLDVASSLERKMEKNRRKYPADEYRGRYGPDDMG
jgi:NTP pyrophosphatase (non-canonical NTP hydrolase)